MKHNNLFSIAADRKEVYQALQRDYKRDHRTIQIMDVIGVIAVIYLCRNLSGLDFVAGIVLAVCLISRVFTFIDQSNRNWFMHLIDWEYARDQEEKDEAEQRRWAQMDRDDAAR